MFNKSVLIIIFTLVAFVYLDPMLKNANNYGPYVVQVDEFSKCKGPKSKNATELVMTIDEHLNVVCNYTFLFDCKIDEIKIEVSNINGEKTNHLYNIKVNDPCKHYSMAFIIKQQLNAENCIVKKGIYSNRINLQEGVMAFLGNSFFYGKFSFRTNVISKKGNINCFTCKMNFVKK